MKGVFTGYNQPYSVPKNQTKIRQYQTFSEPNRIQTPQNGATHVAGIFDKLSINLQIAIRNNEFKLLPGENLAIEHIERTIKSYNVEQCDLETTFAFLEKPKNILQQSNNVSLKVIAEMLERLAIDNQYSLSVIA